MWKSALTAVVHYIAYMCLSAVMRCNWQLDSSHCHMLQRCSSIHHTGKRRNCMRPCLEFAYETFSAPTFKRRKYVTNCHWCSRFYSPAWQRTSWGSLCSCCSHWLSSAETPARRGSCKETQTHIQQPNGFYGTWSSWRSGPGCLCPGAQESDPCLLKEDTWSWVRFLLSLCSTVHRKRSEIEFSGPAVVTL